MRKSTNQIIIDNHNINNINKVDDCLLETIRCAKIMLNILLSQWIMFRNE